MSDHLARAARRLGGMFGLGRIKLVDDTGPVQMAQIDLGHTSASGQVLRDKTPILANFGFTSVPPKDADVAVIFLRGDRSSGVVVGTGHQEHRLKNLEPGDSALYDQRGAYIWFKAAGLVIDAAGLDVTIQNAADIDITSSGTVTVTAAHVNVISDDVNLGDSGGAAVARVGDPVAGGVITAGSTKVKAA